MNWQKPDPRQGLTKSNRTPGRNLTYKMKRIWKHECVFLLKPWVS